MTDSNPKDGDGKLVAEGEPTRPKYSVPLGDRSDLSTSATDPRGMFIAVGPGESVLDGLVNAASVSTDMAQKVLSRLYLFDPTAVDAQAGETEAEYSADLHDAIVKVEAMIADSDVANLTPVLGEATAASDVAPGPESARAERGFGRRGTVFLLITETPDQVVGYWDGHPEAPDEGCIDEMPDMSSAHDAVAWARSRSDRVVIRADGAYPGMEQGRPYWAGTGDYAGSLPLWPESHSPLD